MAVTISLTADASGVTQTTARVSANLTAAFGGIQKQLQAMESTSGQVTNKMITGLQQLSSATRPAVFGVNDLGAAFIKTGQAAGATTSQLQRLPGIYGAVGTSAKKAAEGVTAAGDAGKSAASGLTSFGQSLRGVAAGFGLVLGVQGLASLVNSIVDAGLQMERFERTLIAATGSAKAGAEAWRFITAESNRLGQSVTSMVPIFVQLTAATRNTVLEGERTRELFSALAGAGQAVGLSTEAVGGAMLGLTQIISQNAIQLDEFRNQFASRIPGAMLETAKALKVLGVTQTGTIAEMLKGFERGRISVADLTKAVTMGLREIQRTAPDMANSAEAAFTQLSNAAFQLKADLARSGLLEFLANMAQTARSLIAQVRGAMGLGGADFLQQVGALQGKLAELRKQRQELLDAPLKSRSEDVRTGMVERLNQEIALQEQLLGKLQATHKVEMDAEAEKSRITKERNEEQARQQKAADDAAKAAREGAQDAAARARAQVGLVQERVNQEKIALDQLQALRTRALEADYTAAVDNTQQTKAAQAQVETAFAIRRLDLAKQAALEDATIQEQAVIQVRDAKIAAIKAADAAAQATATAPGATAEAQINANKRSAASAIELQTVNLSAQNAIQDATKKRTEAESAYEKGVSAVVRGERAEQIKITEAQLQRESDLRQQALQGQDTILSAETALVQAQVDGLVLTREEGMARTQAIERQALAVSRMFLEERFQNELRLLEQRVVANTATEEDIAAIRARHTQDVQAMNLQEQAQAQVHRNQLLEGWREWVKDVQSALGDFLFRWMDGQVTSIKDVLNDLKSYFFRLIADMVAKAATSAIILPIVTAVVGGGAGAGPEGIGGSGGLLKTILGVLGLGQQANSLFGTTSPLAGAMTGLTDKLWGVINGFDSMLTSQDALTAAMESATLGDVTGGALGGTGGLTGLSPTLGAIGGLAAIGTGIYGALKATNAASKAAFAASAAAGTAALASTALVAAGVIAASTGWTGIGLIAAAVTAIIGTVTQMLIKPAGPSLSVRAGAGLNIGTADGQLQVQGDLGSRVTRREGVERGVAQGVQAQLEEGITNAVMSIVQTINTVALDPAALVGPTQDALQSALRNLQPINTANAKKMEKDLAEQLKFANVAIIGGLLEPVNLAFDQLRDEGDLTEQLDRLPGTTAGLVAVFKTMNEQLDELSKVENTDVKRQISAVRNQVENFGNRIAGTAGQIAENIVDDIAQQFAGQRQMLKLPESGQAIQEMDRSIAGQITGFSTLLTTSLRALELLRSTQRTLTDVGLSGGGMGAQIDRLSRVVSENAARIATDLVSSALGELAPQLDQVLIQPIRIQATTVNALFSDSLAALAALQTAWNQLNAAGLDSKGIQEQFTRLLGGMLEGAFTVITQSFAGGSFAEFLNVLASIPPALAALNPTLQAVQNMGKVFGQVAGPVQQVIDATEEDMRTTEERIARTAKTMADLRKAIADAGDSAEQALPLYAKLAEQIQANAQAQIDAVNEQAQVQIDAANEVAEAQRQVLQETVQVWTDEVNALADSQRTELEKVIDYWTDVANMVADSQREALQQVIAVWTDEVNTLASSQREELEKVIDYWTDVANMVADSQREEMDRIVDVWTEGVNALADSQREEMDRIVETWTDAVNAIADAEMSAMDRWVETTTQMVNDWADSANTAASQLSQVNDILRQEMSPALQRQTLEARKAAIQTRMDAGGPNAQASIGELIQINTDLLALAKQSDDLMQQKQMINELSGMQKALRDQVVAMTGESDPLLAQLTIADQSKKVLEDIAAYQKWQTGVIAGEQQARLEEIAAYQKWQAFVITGTQQAKLEEIAAYQKWQTSVITGEQQATLANIAANQAHAAWVIAGEQQARLADIAAYEKWQTDVIAVQQQAALDTIAANEAYATSVMTGEQQARLAEIEAYEAAQLAYIQSTQDARLKEIGDWQKATVTAIKQDMVYQLQLVQYEIQKLFALQYKALTGVDLPAPTPPPPRQQSAAQGGLIGIASGSYYAHGGMVPDPAQRFARGGLINAMLEPGERVFSPTTKAQQGALLSMNQAFPRLAAGGMVVPGSGSGDTVPAFLRSGSVVLNRRASTVVGALGMQDGGPVPASRGVPVVNIHIAKLEVRNDADIKAIIDGITRQLSREWRSSNDKGPFR